MQSVKSLQIEQVNYHDLVQSFQSIVKDTIRQELEKHSSNTPQPEYMTRKEVAELFKITLPTVHAWTNAGLLKAYKIGSKTRFKRSEVMESPKAIQRDLNNV